MCIFTSINILDFEKAHTYIYIYMSMKKNVGIIYIYTYYIYTYYIYVHIIHLCSYTLLGTNITPFQEAFTLDVFFSMGGICQFPHVFLAKFTRSHVPVNVGGLLLSQLTARRKTRRSSKIMAVTCVGILYLFTQTIHPKKNKKKQEAFVGDNQR